MKKKSWESPLKLLVPGLTYTYEYARKKYEYLF